MTSPVQPPLPFGPTGADLRDAGMARVLNALPQQSWRQKADAWMLALPPGARVTAIDLTDAVGLPPSVNAVGAVMRAAATAGVLVATDDFTRSDRPARHAGILRVWKAPECRHCNGRPPRGHFCPACLRRTASHD